MIHTPSNNENKMMAVVKFRQTLSLIDDFCCLMPLSAIFHSQTLCTHCVLVDIIFSFTESLIELAMILVKMYAKTLMTTTLTHIVHDQLIISIFLCEIKGQINTQAG